MWSSRRRGTRESRFRRGGIIGAAARGSAILMGIAWMALKPQVFRQVAQESDLAQPMAKPGTDALSGLPSSYADAPKLGPPLPGDLGRPILRAQERTEGAVAPSAADAARQQRLAGIKAARESGLMVQIATTPSTSGPAPVADMEPLPSVPGETPPSDAIRKERFEIGRANV